MKIRVSILAILALLAFTAPAYAENFPDKPFEFVVISSPGSGASLYAQVVAKIASEIMKVPVNLVHKPSGNGNLACDYVVSKPADGYTFLNWTSSVAGYMNFPHFQTKPDNFDFLCEMQKAVYCLVVPADSQFKTIQDLIAYAKANPGKLDIGSSKMGNPQQMNVLNFSEAAGIEVNYIPYNGTGEALKDVLGNHLSVGEIQPFLVLSHLKSGKVRILLTFNEERIPELPDVPVPADLGLNYPFYHQSLGIVLKAGTPPDRLQKLSEVFKQVLEHPEYKAYIAQSAGMIAYWKGSEAFKKDFLRDYKKVGEIIKKYNITGD